MGFEKFIVVSSAVMVIIVAFGLNIWECLFFGGGGFKLFLNIYISMIIENSIVKFYIYCFYMIIS